MRRVLAVTLGGVVLLGMAVAIAILWPVREAPLADARPDLLVTNVRVVDVEAGNSGEVTRVLIRDGRIAAIGADLTDEGLPLLDAGGGYMVPGFWDMHVHSFQLSPQLHLPLYLANGVTAVRDMMDCPGPRDALIACVADKRQWTAEVDRGARSSPRFIEVASFYFERPDITPAEVTQLAAAYRERGLDALKVYNRLSPEAYRQLAVEAGRHGLRLVGHLPREVALDEAIAAGQASFEHAHLLVRHCYAHAAEWRDGTLDMTDPVALAEDMVARHDPAACDAIFARMREAGAWFVPTHVTREEDARAAEPAFVNDPRLDWLDPLSRWAYRDDLSGTVRRYPDERGQRVLEAYFELGLALTGRAYRAGVPVLVGTDTAIGGFRYHDEMAHLVRAGLSPAEVLRAATLDAARYAGLEDEFGTVAVGKVADLVILEDDPLASIGNTARIRAVILGGRLYDRPLLDELLDFVRRQARAPGIWARLVWGFVTSSVSREL